MNILVYILYKGVAIRHNLIYLIIKIHKFIEELSPMSKTYTNPETIGLHAGWRKDENTFERTKRMIRKREAKTS